MPGEKAVGRCAGKAIEFEVAEGGVSGVMFVPASGPRRARARRRGQTAATS